MGDEEDIDGGLDQATSGALPAGLTGLDALFAQSLFTNPKAQKRAGEILDRYDALGEDQYGPENKLISSMQDQATKTQEALRKARARLLDTRIPDPWLTAAGAMAPTKTGNFGETIGNYFGALGQERRKQFEDVNARNKQLLELDTGEATANNPVIQAQFDLEKLKTTQQQRMAIEALKILGKPSLNNQAAGIIPKSIEALDRQYAKQYLDWTTKGDPETTAAIANLDEATKIMQNSDTISGPIVGLLPKWARDEAFPESGNVQDLIEQEVQMSLRQILGAQFTQREGEGLLARVFNPRQEENVNRARANRLSVKLKAALQNERAKAAYYGEHGTLGGFPGVKQYSIRDFYPDPKEGGGRQEGRAANVNPLVNQVPGLGGLGKTKPVTIDKLNPDQLEEARAKYQKQFGKPAPFKKGGRVQRTHFQEGGQVIVLDDGTKVTVPDATDDQSSGRYDLSATMVNDPGLMGYLRDQADKLKNAGVLTMGAGAVGGMGLESLVRKYGNPMNRGLPWRTGGEEQVMRSLEQDNLDPTEELEDVRRSNRRGVPEMLVDRGSSNTRALARKAISNSGQPGEDIVEDITDRNAGARDRVSEQVNKGIKPYDYFGQLDKLQDDLRSNAKPLYDAAYAKYPGISEPPEIRAILDTPAGQKAVKRAVELMQNAQLPIGKANALGIVQRPSLQFYDYVKRGFDDQIRKEEKSGPTNRGRTMRDLRTQFRDYLDQAAPEYAAARQQYSGDLETFDALQQGRDFTKARPQELAAARQNMGFSELNAYRTGMAQRIDEMLMDPSNDINAAKKLIGSPAMVERLRPFFDSPQQFTVFQEALRREAELFETGRRFAGTAQSARDKKAMEKMTITDYMSKRLPGFRFAIAPLGFALRALRDRPQMSEAEANSVVQALRTTGQTALKDMTRRAKTRELFTKYKGARRGAAALTGAAAAAFMSGDEDAEGTDSPDSPQSP